MSILAICGGMRQESNTNKLVNKIAEASGQEYEVVDFGSMDIKPCNGCMECMMNEGQCPIEDDIKPLYDKLLQADAVIIGTPTYYENISGAVKCLIDRSMALNYRGIGPAYDPDMPFMGNRPLAGKPGVAVTTVAGVGHEKCMEALMMCLNGYRLNVVAQIAEPVGMNDIADMPEVLQRAEEAGKKLAAALS
jgi:multimeric flavodoxin WrbA